MRACKSQGYSGRDILLRLLTTSVAETAAEAHWSRLMIKHPGVRGRYGEDHEGEPGEDRESRGDVLKALHLLAPFACEDFERHEIVDARSERSRIDQQEGELV